MKTLPRTDLQDSLLPGPLVFHKLKNLVGDEDLKRLDLLAFIKIDPCLMLQFLNCNTCLDPKLTKQPIRRPVSLEEAAADLKQPDILKFIQLELVKAEGFRYSRECSAHYHQLWEKSLFTATFLEGIASLLHVDAGFAYTLGLFSSIDLIVECFLEYGAKASILRQSAEIKENYLQLLSIPEALLLPLVAQKTSHTLDKDIPQDTLAQTTSHALDKNADKNAFKDALAYALWLANQLQAGKRIDTLAPNVGFTLEALPSLYKKAEKRMQDIHRFISVF